MKEIYGSRLLSFVVSNEKDFISQSVKQSTQEKTVQQVDVPQMAAQSPKDVEVAKTEDEIKYELLDDAEVSKEDRIRGSLFGLAWVLLLFSFCLLLQLL